MFGGQQAEEKSAVALGSCVWCGRGLLITSPFRRGQAGPGSGEGRRGQAGPGRGEGRKFQSGPRLEMYCSSPPRRIGYYPQPL